MFLLQSIQSGSGAYLGTWSPVPGSKVTAGQGEAGHSSKCTDEVKSEAVPPHPHMPSWCTPLPFLAKQYCMYSTATMGHVIHNPCHDQECWPVQSFKKAEAWEGLIHGSVI